MSLPQPDYEGDINIHTNKIKVYLLAASIIIAAGIAIVFMYSEREDRVAAISLFASLGASFTLLFYSALFGRGPIIKITREEIRIRSAMLYPLHIPLKFILRVKYHTIETEIGGMPAISLYIDREFGKSLRGLQKWAFAISNWKRRSPGIINLPVTLAKVKAVELSEEIERRVKELRSKNTD